MIKLFGPPKVAIASLEATYASGESSESLVPFAKVPFGTAFLSHCHICARDMLGFHNANDQPQALSAALLAAALLAAAPLAAAPLSACLPRTLDVLEEPEVDPLL